MSEREYTRLARARRRVAGGVISVGAGYASLWLGKDHLLCVDSNGFTEEYKRFYYRDIQAIVLQRDARQLVNGLLLGLPLLLLLIGVAVNAGNPDDAVAFWIFLVIATLFGAAFLYNLLAGRTVKCYLQSAVQTELLPSLNRWRRAHNAINRLRPLIAAAQGELPREEIAQRMEAALVAEPPPLINP